MFKNGGRGGEKRETGLSSRAEVLERQRPRRRRRRRTRDAGLAHGARTGCHCGARSRCRLTPATGIPGPRTSMPVTPRKGPCPHRPQTSTRQPAVRSMVAAGAHCSQICILSTLPASPSRASSEAAGQALLGPGLGDAGHTRGPQQRCTCSLLFSSRLSCRRPGAAGVGTKHRGNLGSLL